MTALETGDSGDKTRSELDVDVIIAVHDPARRLLRAVSSVLDTNRSRIRVSVVCHGIAEQSLAEQLSRFAGDPRLRVCEFHDGVRSPAGPFNAGLEAATGRYVSVMGSDDELESGAIDGWLKTALRDRADVVIPRLRHANGVAVPTPPARPWRRKRLDGVRDRLSYRSAPLGLVSREVFGNMRFTSGVATGEDIAYVTRLWFSSDRISLATRAPGYLIHDDAPVRASSASRTVAADLAFLPLLLTDSWVNELSEPARRALAIKLWRINIFGVIHNRRDSALEPDDVATLARVGVDLIAFAPSAPAVLSRADRRLVEAICSGKDRGEDLIHLAARRRSFLTPSALLPRNIAWVLAREAPVRMMAASALVRLGL